MTIGGGLRATAVGANRREIWGLTLVRATLGLIWLDSLTWKLPPSFGCPADFAVSGGFDNRTSGLCDWFGLMTAYSMVPLQSTLIGEVVVPNLILFSWLVFTLEALLSASLVLGAFTRIGSALGLAMSVNLLLGLSRVPHEWFGTYVLMIALHAVFLTIGPGRLFGVDRVILGAPRAGNRLIEAIRSVL